MLKRWAEAKFKLPWRHSVFQEATLLELLTDFWEDYYLKNKIAARTTKDGHVVFDNTGDALIDKWERELAAGLDPDLLEGCSPEEREKERQALERLKAKKVLADKVNHEKANDGFSENYTAFQKAGMSLLGQKGH